MFLFTMTQQPLVGQGLVIIEASRSHSDTTHSVGSSGRVISPMPSPLLDNTQLSQQTDIPSGIGTQNPSRRATEGPRFRSRGHWDRQQSVIRVIKWIGVLHSC